MSKNPHKNEEFPAPFPHTGGYVSWLTREREHEEAAWVCDAAFQMATDGIRTGRRIARTWVKLVTDQTAKL